MSLPAYLNQNSILARFLNNPLQPSICQEKCPWVIIPAQIGPNQNLAAGQVLAQQTAASTPDVQTVTLSGGSGAMTWQLVHPTLGPTIPLAYNISLVNLAAALATVFGTGNWAVTGTPGSSYVLTGAGALVAGYQTLMSVANVSSGLTCTIAKTTNGILNGAYVAVNDSLIANPTTAPTLAASGADGTLAVGAYSVVYTFVNANGESLPSPAATIAVGNTNHIAISSITGIPNGVTSVNVYVNGTFFKNQAVTTNATGAFNILAPAAGASLDVPFTSTLYAAVDGSQVAKGILVVPCYTDVFGNLTYGQGSGSIIPVTGYTAEMLVKGYVQTNLLTGLDATTLAQLSGRLVQGSLSSGVCVIN